MHSLCLCALVVEGACHVPQVYSQIHIGVDHEDAQKPVSYLVHLNLKNSLSHFQSKGHMKELVSSLMCVESGEILAF